MVRCTEHYHWNQKSRIKPKLVLEIGYQDCKFNMTMLIQIPKKIDTSNFKTHGTFSKTDLYELYDIFVYGFISNCMTAPLF